MRYYPSSSRDRSTEGMVAMPRRYTTEIGFTIRHYKDRRTRTGYKLLITPSAASVMRIKQVLRDEWFRLQGTNVQAILHALNPIVRGWANYFRIAVASQTFDRLDYWMFQREVRYAHRTHPHKPWYWKKERYWGRLNPMRNDHWVLGDKHTGGYLLKFSWHRIHRHPLVRGTASPDDPALTDYWAKRQTQIGAKEARTLPPRKRWLAGLQHYVCPLCGEPIQNGEEIHEHHLKGRQAGNGRENVILLHAYCHQRIHAQKGVIAPVRLA